MTDDSLIPSTPSAADYGVADDQGEVFTSDDPITLFGAWFDLAKTREVNDANAMSLASVDGQGQPNVRIVLLKDVDATGFSFFSNSQSAKGQELAEQSRAALCFHWKSIRRQVRVRGAVMALGVDACDEYFSSRARGSQIGAWASAQSRPLVDRAELEQRIADYEVRFASRDVPRPDHWQGWRIIPQEIEFWVNRPYRLHDRKRFTCEAGHWAHEMLYP